MRRENNLPIPDGVRLYKSLAEKERVILVGTDKTDIDRWMKQNNLSSKLDDILDYNPGEAFSDVKKYRQVLHARSRGPVDYVITDDLELAKSLLEEGLSVFLFLHPKYFNHKFRPDRPSGIRAWSDIVHELDKQQKLYEEDNRV